MKPIDEKREFFKFCDRKKYVEDLANKKDAASILERRMIIRKERRDRLLKQVRKPERNVFEMNEATQEYKVKVDN